ncbi:ET module [Ostertagia ostertagi]
MPSMRVAVFLLALVCSAIAFQCYNGITTSDGNPSAKTDCLSYCTKVVASVGDKTTYNYGCDGTKMCTKNGCYSGIGGALTCCCGSDLCNSSTKLSALFAVVPIALMKLFAF